MCNHKWMVFGVDSGGQYRICSKCNKKVYIISNADRIRTMSDEELVDWAINKVPQIASRYSDSKLGLLDWIKRSAEEDT